MQRKNLTVRFREGGVFGHDFDILNSSATSQPTTKTSSRYFGKRVECVTKVFQSAVKRVGIAHATPHALHHAGITEGVHAPGANVVDISHIVGHKDFRTTIGSMFIALKLNHYRGSGKSLNEPS